MCNTSPQGTGTPAVSICTCATRRRSRSVDLIDHQARLLAGTHVRLRIPSKEVQFQDPDGGVVQRVPEGIITESRNIRWTKSVRIEEPVHVAGGDTARLDEVSLHHRT